MIKRSNTRTSASLRGEKIGLMFKKVYNNFDPNVLNVLKVENSVNSKKSFGGTNKQNVIKMINKTLKELR